MKAAWWIGWLYAAILLLSFSVAGAAALKSDEGIRGDSLQQTYAVKVYPDGGFDWDYVKQNVPYINYVRDRVDAELYLLATMRTTGAGGNRVHDHCRWARAIRGNERHACVLLEAQRFSRNPAGGIRENLENGSHEIRRAHAHGRRYHDRVPR